MNDSFSNKPLLTVIVPVFNTEKYLRKCLDSIVYQTYQNIEVLIIDDCSTDNSKSIVFEYQKEHHNLKYYKNDNNMGVGYSRKFGAENAEGDYIAFIDSDDWIELNYYDKMIKTILEDKSDIAVSGVISEYNNYISAEPRYEINYHQVIDSSFALRIMAKYYMQNFYISPNMNNRVYKKSLVVDNSICNDFSKQAQDNYSSFFAFLYASKVSLVPDIYYHYYQRSGSAVHSFSEEYINNYFNVLKHIKQTLKDINQLEKNKEVFMCFTDRSINWIVSCLIKAKIKEATQKKCLKLIRNNCLDLFSPDDYIDYLDTKRILKLFD